MIGRKKRISVTSKRTRKTRKGTKTLTKRRVTQTIKKTTGVRKGRRIRLNPGIRSVSYNQAYDAGFDAAYNEGFNVGYPEGLAAGQQAV